MEAYVSGGSHKDRSGGAFHLTLLAENIAGYNNLMQLYDQGAPRGFLPKAQGGS